MTSDKTTIPMPILAYHSIDKPVDEPGAGLYCVPIERFKEQIRYISELTSCRVNELSSFKQARLRLLNSTRHSLEVTVNSLQSVVNTQSVVGSQQSVENNTKDQKQKAGDEKRKKKNEENSRKIILTFDDGDVTNYEYAFPALRELGLKAYFFILAGRVGIEGYMSWQQIKELVKAGMVIGSHGMTHRILDRLPTQEIEFELNKSKMILEEQLGIGIDTLSIPRGFYNRKIIALAKQAGYRQVFTSNPKDNDGYCIGRITIMASLLLPGFKRIIENGLPMKERIKNQLKDSAKKMMGSEVYDRVRGKIVR